MTARREHRLVFLLTVAQRRLQRWIAAQTQQSGVTATQSGLLFVLGQRDGVLMGEAGAALDLGPPGISGLVDRMTAARLIERRADPDDGRAWRLWLTPVGRTCVLLPDRSREAMPGRGFAKAWHGVGRIAADGVTPRRSGAVPSPDLRSV